jgi:hypothetical protein
MRNGVPDDTTYPSRNIAFQAAGMITSIIENLAQHDELRYCPAFIVYSLFSALIMHVYQMRSSIPSVVSATQERLQVCMNALKDVSKVWLVAKMVHTLFESILGNKHLEDKLQKAAGKRHKKPQDGTHSHGLPKEEMPKRKYDDMEIAFTAGPPAPQVSYERSRPQTPAVTPSRDLGQAPVLAPMGAPTVTTPSPHIRQSNDTFMGGINSRSNTRPPTPFNPSFSVPTTPPDLYLVTRNSPPVSQNIWENFQPDQLFPESLGNLSLAQQFSPPVPLDGSLAPSMPTMPGSTPNMTPSQLPNILGQQQQQQHLPQRSGQMGMAPGLSPPTAGTAPGVLGAGSPGLNWPTSAFDQMDMAGSSPDDTWSNSSKGQPVPTTLNVEDWYVLVYSCHVLCAGLMIPRFQFFGINGDANVLDTTMT